MEILVALMPKIAMAKSGFPSPLKSATVSESAVPLIGVA
jgi:hypothetical protein